jgi:uncharacterized protein (DUF885 family)
MKKLLCKLYPNNDELPVKELIELIISDQKYIFQSEDELVKTYQDKVNELSDIINFNNIPIKYKCNFMKIHDQNASCGFYLNNCFYLNTYKWDKQRKYDVRSLTMHESYPGHHMQIDISTHNSKDKYLSKIYQENLTSFIEGWGLFAESLHSDEDLSSNFGQLDADLLRILRIIIDIDLHYNGLSPDKAIEKMSKYLSTDVELIVPEVYRYVAYPAQAMSYKIGETVYKEIYNKIKKDNNLNIDSKEMYLEYINILKNGECCINHLLSKYNMNFFPLLARRSIF